MKQYNKTQRVLLTLALGIALLYIFGYSVRNEIEIIKDNQRDIDRRITNLEQSINQTDTAIVNLYQHLNEIAYKIKK